MPQTLLETRKHRFVVTSFDIDDAARRKPSLCHRRRKQILPRHAPQHFAERSRRNTGREQRRSGAVDGSIAAARHLVQRTERQSASWQHLVDKFNAERQHLAITRSATFKPRDALAKLVDCCGIADHERSRDLPAGGEINKSSSA